jgi:hypothetical protein
MPLYTLRPVTQGLLVEELTRLIVSQREGRDATPPEAVAADIIDRVLRKQLPRDPQTIEGKVNDHDSIP